MTEQSAPRLAAVETLYETNARSIPDMLRQAADSIDADPDDAPTAAVAVFVDAAGTVQIYGWGDVNDLSALGLIERGKHELLGILSDD